MPSSRNPGSEQCPHCQSFVTFEDALKSFEKVPCLELGEEWERMELAALRCTNPACGKYVIELIDAQLQMDEQGDEFWSESSRRRLYPKDGGARARLESGAIPEQFLTLYNEAVDIELLSVRGACGVLRTCLEAVLFHLGFKESSLEKQIDAAVSADLGWPSALLSKLQVVRLVGNFGAHWSLDGEGNVIEVDASELEATFTAVEQLLRVVFVDPHVDAADIERINKKLEKTGRPMRIGPKGTMVDADGNPWPPPKKVKAVS